MSFVDDLTVMGAGVGVGILQTHLLRKYADVKYPATAAEKLAGKRDGEMYALKGFGKPSVLAGVGVGGVAAGYELNKATKNRRMTTEDYFGYGYGLGAVGSALVSGVTEIKIPPTTPPTSEQVRRVVVNGGGDGREVRSTVREIVSGGAVGSSRGMV